MKNVIKVLAVMAIITVVCVGMIDRINRTQFVKTSKAMENGYVVYSFNCEGLNKINQKTKIVDNMNGDIKMFDHELTLIEYFERIGTLKNIKTV